MQVLGPVQGTCRRIQQPARAARGLRQIGRADVAQDQLRVREYPLLAVEQDLLSSYPVVRVKHGEESLRIGYPKDWEAIGDQRLDFHIAKQVGPVPRSLGLEAR